MFDPEKFGAAMGEAIQKAVAPLQKEIADLKEKLAEKPDFTAMVATAVERAVAGIQLPKEGKDCDMEAVKAFIAEAVKAIPVINGKDGAPGADGKDGTNGEHGKSVTLEDVQPMIDKALSDVKADAAGAVQAAIKSIPVPKDGVNGKDGIDGAPGADGQKGADGLGLAGAMIDRDGALQVTFTNGEGKNLGPVVGKDGLDGIGLDAFELEYLPESHEIAIKAVVGARTKELRYPAGGIRPAGYWREGTKAKAGEAWVHDGSLWIAIKNSELKPATSADAWIIAARKGRDGETIVKTINANPGPIKLKDGNG